MIKCSKCHKEILNTSKITTGYGADKDNNKICYDCCADDDRQYMRDNGKITLYLSKNEVTNWPGSLSMKVLGRTTGKHNIAGIRYDVSFRFEGKLWYGTQYGDNTQLCHCKAYKS